MQNIFGHTMDQFEEDKEYMRELLLRFENNKSSNGFSFFDSSELEDIIFYYFNEGNIQKANTAIEFALDNFPEDVSFHVFKAQFFLNNGEPEKALARLNSVEAIDPSNAEVILTRANVFGAMQRHQDAIHDFLKALKMVNEDKDEIHTSIAFEYQNLRNYTKAIEHLQKALKFDPANDGLLYEIGYCYEVGEMSDKAVDFFTSVVNKDPYSFVGWYNLGMAYSNLELFEKAIDALDYSLAIDTTFIPSYFSKAQCYEQMEMYQQAINIYKQTFEFEKPDAMTLYYIGDCYTSLLRYDVAIDYYRKSIAIERQFSDAWMGIGICSVELGKYMEALVHVEQAINIESDNVEYYILLAEIHTNLGNKTKAEEAYIKASEIQPYHPEIWLDYSNLHAAEYNNYIKALEILDEGIFYQPGNSNMMYRRVAYLYLSGYIQEALTELYIALANDFKSHISLLEYDEIFMNSIEIQSTIESMRNQNFTDLS